MSTEEEESMQEGREKKTVRMCKFPPSTGHTQVIFAFSSKEANYFIFFNYFTVLE